MHKMRFRGLPPMYNPGTWKEFTPLDALSRSVPSCSCCSYTHPLASYASDCGHVLCGDCLIFTEIDEEKESLSLETTSESLPSESRATCGKCLHTCTIFKLTNYRDFLGTMRLECGCGFKGTLMQQRSHSLKCEFDKSGDADKEKLSSDNNNNDKSALKIRPLIEEIQKAKNEVMEKLKQDKRATENFLLTISDQLESISIRLSEVENLVADINEDMMMLNDDSKYDSNTPYVSESENSSSMANYFGPSRSVSEQLPVEVVGGSKPLPASNDDCFQVGFIHRISRGVVVGTYEVAKLLETFTATGKGNIVSNSLTLESFPTLFCVAVELIEGKTIDVLIRSKGMLIQDGELMGKGICVSLVDDNDRVIVKKSISADKLFDPAITKKTNGIYRIQNFCSVAVAVYSESKRHLNLTLTVEP